MPWPTSGSRPPKTQERKADSPEPSTAPTPPKKPLSDHPEAVSSRAKRRRRLAHGKCRNCGRVRAQDPLARHVAPTLKTCSTCYFKKKARSVLGDASLWEGLRLLFEKQEGRCNLSGEPVVLGDDSQLDHIVPVCKGGPDSLGNVQWTIGRYNAMKGALAVADFARSCLNVAIYHHSDDRRRIERNRRDAANYSRAIIDCRCAAARLAEAGARARQQGDPGALPGARREAS